MSILSSILSFAPSARARRVEARILLAAAFLAAATLLAACGGDEEVYVERPVEDLYNEAMDLLIDRDYELAATAFDEVERQHPYSVWATRAQLMAAYAHYRNADYDSAVGAAERFVELHPGHVDAAYAHYLIALSHYVRISDVGRDQRMSELAFDAFEEVRRRYPDTRYARDAALKAVLVRDHLAGKEMEVGRVYQDLEFYVAAIGRFRNVIAEYETTTHVPEALLRLVECWVALGVVSEARATAAVLGHNFPGSEWYRDAWALLEGGAPTPDAEDGSWFSWLF